MRATTSSVGRAVQLAVAALVAVATSLLVPVAPASAAACPTADGVTVVVDFHELGGGVQSACVPDGAGVRASDLFPRAGFPLSYVQRQPGFVCRVSGKPADSSCVNTPPADAYWGLWWSDGKSGRWTYSTTSAGGLTVPDGGYAAFSWNGSDGNVPPGTSPVPHADPTPTQQPSSAHPTKQPSAQATPQQSSEQSSAAPGESASESASESVSPSGQPGTDVKKPGKSRTAPASARPAASAAASPGATATEDTVVPASADPADAGDDGLPVWVAPVLVIALFGAAGGVALARRRRGGAS